MRCTQNKFTIFFIGRYLLGRVGSGWVTKSDQCPTLVQMSCLVRACIVLRADTTQTTRYHVVTQNKNWQAAHDYCRTHYNSKLVMIDSADDQLHLQAYLETMNGQQACFSILSS